jgi:ATP-dependent helicase/nuclease subunit B
MPAAPTKLRAHKSVTIPSMGVRFVIGRAGTGKTHHCLQAIRQKLLESPVDGPRLIFLVPEQASQQMERAILLPTDPADAAIPASHRAEVFSFQRLAARLLESAAVTLPDTLSDSARIMVLRHLAAEHASELRYYRRVQRHAGFLEHLSSTISELIQEGVAPDALGPASNFVHQDQRSSAKFHDLRILYEAYLRFLGSGLLDPSQNLQLARACIARSTWIQSAEIWMDGFASLSGEETATLLEMARHAKHTEIAVLLDPSCVQHTSSPTAARSLFARTARTFGELSELFRDAGLTVEAPLVLQPKSHPRFERNHHLALLEQSLFTRPMSASPARSDLTTTPTNISLVELPSRRVEVEYAVSLICEWTRCDPPRFRYRDIAIIVRDLDPYYDLVRSALEDRAIACFIDRRRPIAHHPLVELLRIGTLLPVEGLTLELARVLLKTGLLPLDIEAADELENYLLAHGIEGFEAWTAGDWSRQKIGRKPDPLRPTQTWEIASLSRVNQARSTVVIALKEWFDFANQPEGHSGAEWSQGLLAWIVHLGVPAALSQWARHAQEQGDIDQAGEHEQTWSDVEKFLDSLTVAFGERVLRKDELAEVVDAGLGSLSLGLVPPTVDQVLVGSIERTRHPDIKAAILLGFNDGIFPARIEENSILNDDDRSRLMDAGVRIGLPTRQRLHDESMLVYIALTRASQELVITYARADEKHAALRPSPFVQDVLTACPGLTLAIVHDSVRDRSLWDLQTSADLRRRLTTEFRTRPSLAQDPSPMRARWNQLYNQTRAVLATDPVTLLACSSLRENAPAALSRESVARLFPGTLHTSVSTLEIYAACPFKYFAEKVLRLAERAEAPLADIDVGKVHHTIMEELAKNMVDRNVGFGQLSSDELLSTLRFSCESAADRLKTEDGLSNARDAYVLRRSAAQLSRIVRAQQRACSSGAMRPKAAELSFGYAPELMGLPALDLTTPQGHRVLLRGFIDRVDLVEAADELLGIVVDYKDTRNKTLQYTGVYHGLSLQLLAYLLVLAEQGATLAGRPIRPAGALYVSLGAHYEKVNHPECAEDRNTSQQGTFRPRGLLGAEHLEKMKIELEPGCWAPHYAIYRKQDGELGRLDTNDAAPQPSFDAMLQHTRRRMGELADGILDGHVQIRPYRLGSFSPCSWCRMTAVCRFESGLCDVEYLETLKRSEIYVRVGGVADSELSKTEPRP